MACNNLATLLDALTDTSVYVIEAESRRLLFFNRRCREIGRGRAALGVPCNQVWPEVCANCPLQGLEGKDSNHIVCYDPLLKATVDVSANRILWDGQIPAVVITTTPHRLNFEEEQGLRKIEKMYASSLVTVFGECIIANLTRDYYVNCQKDAMWTDIPEQGNFAAENRKYAQQVIHPDDLQLFNDNFSRESMLREFTKGRRQITRRLRRLAHDGAYRMVEFTATRIDHLGESECWCVLVFRDVQEEYLLEQQRSLEVSQLATAAKAAYQMLIAVNLTQNSYHMLAYARHPVKEPPEQGIFNELMAFELETVHPDYREVFVHKFFRPYLMEAFVRGERIVNMEVPHLGDDGAYHWSFTQVVRVESPQTDDLIEITLSRNIDEERRLQQQALEKEIQAKKLLEDALKKAERANRAKSDFLSKMSHDIRTPLNAIMGMTQLAQMHTGEQARLEDYLKKIAASGTHLLGLINEVLDVSKIESGAVELEESEADLRELVRDVAEMVRLTIEGRSQVFTVRVDEALHAGVQVDVMRLKQVLVNILENASKYTGEGGRIAFSVQELQKNELQVGTYCFVVEDTGIGMKGEYLEHIFEPFSRADDSRTSKVSGTGLGMTIVKSLVDMMGGEIEVTSEYHKGSRFTITLCLTKCDDASSAMAQEPAQPDGESFPQLRVLLVEDNELNRQIASEMLELMQVKVETAEDGRQAVEAVLSHAPLYYDLVFMDVQMPVMNGYEAARAIRASGLERIQELPIFAMTADAFAEDAKLARMAGMNGHLAKPISMKRLRSVLSNCQVWRDRNRKSP